MAASGTTMQRISRTSLGNMTVPVTDYDEQVRITNYLDKKCAEIDAIIAAKEKTNELLKERRQSIIYEAVTKGLDPTVPMKDSGVEWIGEIPESWITTRIKYTSTLKGRIGWQGLKSDEYIDEGPYLITGTDFVSGVIDWKNCAHISNERFEEAPEIHIFEGDLLITKDGTIGKLAIAENCPDEVSLNSGVLLIRNKERGEYLNKYLYYVLQSDVFWKWFRLSQNGNSTIIHLYQEQFSNFRYSLPSINEQKDIVDYLDTACMELDSLINANESTIEKLKEYRQSIIYEAVTGKVEI
jgi:type I restriction enzyme S subunit